jgi:excisionase family DNA binding protein
MTGSSATAAPPTAEAIADDAVPRQTEGLPVQMIVQAVVLEAIAERVREILDERRDDGFLDVDGAAAFLGGCSRKAIYHLVARGRIRAHRVGGRLLFDPAELRADVERGE